MLFKSKFLFFLAGLGAVSTTGAAGAGIYYGVTKVGDDKLKDAKLEQPGTKVLLAGEVADNVVAQLPSAPPAPTVPATEV